MNVYEAVTEYNRLKDRVNNFINITNKNIPNNDELFNEIAIEIFAYQYKFCQFYRKFYDWKGISPNEIKNYEDIPPIPVSALKEAKLTTIDTNNYFLTSGTTRGKDKRGKHYYHDLSLYSNASILTFKNYVMPDFEYMNTIVLGLPFSAMKTSSLYYMLDIVSYRLSNGKFHYFYEESDNQITENSGNINYENAVEVLKYYSDIKEPVLILGTTAAIVNLCDILKQKKSHLKLPIESRIMDTGGVKGMDIEYGRNEVTQLYERYLNIKPVYVVNEYGMTELFSQYYTGNLFDYKNDRNADYGLDSSPWLKCQVINPNDGSKVKDSEQGIICHIDLLNISSVLSIMTEDIGQFKNGRLYLEGRSPDSDLRGCSLTVLDLK